MTLAFFYTLWKQNKIPVFYVFRGDKKRPVMWNGSTIRDQYSRYIKDINSWRWFLSYRNQYIDLFCKLMDWFLYDRNLRHERCSSNETSSQI